MSISTSPIFAIRYVSAVSIAALVYDHLLTLEREIMLIWLNPTAGILNRGGFIINRYLTEGVAIYMAHLFSGVGQNITHESCRAADWIFTMCSSVFITISYFIIMWRVYTLWDRRRLVKWILMTVFFISSIIATTFAILSAVQLQDEVSYNPIIKMCTVAQKPWGLKYTMAALTGFDFFIIVLTIINALDRPHKRQADVMISLQHDGARMFVCIFVLRFATLIMAIIGNEATYLGPIMISWAMCSVVSSRIQLRVESLRFYRLTAPPFLAGVGSHFELEDL